jgi:hypothetical protein
VIIWRFPRSTADNGDAVAQIQSAILRFKGAGVTHVLPIEQNSSFFFAPGAEAQRYRPRYGINSNNYIAQFAGNPIPYEQLRGAVGVGWHPEIDLPESMAGKSPYAGPGRESCLKALTKAGVTFETRDARLVGLLACDLLYSLRAAVTRIPAGAGVNAPSLVQAVERLDRSFAVAALPQAVFGPGRRFPVARGWTLRFDEKCRCTLYGGPARALR